MCDCDKDDICISKLLTRIKELELLLNIEQSKNMKLSVRIKELELLSESYE